MTRFSVVKVWRFLAENGALTILYGVAPENTAMLKGLPCPPLRPKTCIWAILPRRYPVLKNLAEAEVQRTSEMQESHVWMLLLAHQACTSAITGPHQKAVV